VLSIPLIARVDLCRGCQATLVDHEVPAGGRCAHCLDVNDRARDLALR